MKRSGWRILFCIGCLISVPFIHAREIAVTNYKTTHYSLSIEIDYSEELVYGQCMLTVRNNSDSGISAIPLLLYKLFEVSAVKDNLGNPLSFSQEVEAFVDWPVNRVNYIKVALAGTLEPEQEFTLVIEYAGPLSGNTEASRYVHDHISEEFTVIRPDCYTYPIIGVPVDREMMAIGYKPSFNYTLKVKVPKGLTVANMGQLDSLVHTESHSIFTYSNIKPAWRMDIRGNGNAVSRDGSRERFG